jgi:hypothetical protein
MFYGHGGVCFKFRNAASITSSGSNYQFWGYAGGGSQGWRGLTAGNGIGISGYTVSVATGTGLDFNGTSVVVTTAPYATGAGTASTVVNGAITVDKIGSGAVTADKIAADAVGGTKIADNAVTESKIAANSIDTDHFKYTAEHINKNMISRFHRRICDVPIMQNMRGRFSRIYASSELLAREKLCP